MNHEMMAKGARPVFEAAPPAVGRERRRERVEPRTLVVHAPEDGGEPAGATPEVTPEVSRARRIAEAARARTAQIRAQSFGVDTTRRPAARPPATPRRQEDEGQLSAADTTTRPPADERAAIAEPVTPSEPVVPASLRQQEDEPEPAVWPEAEPEAAEGGAGLSDVARAPAFVPSDVAVDAAAAADIGGEPRAPDEPDAGPEAADPSVDAVGASDSDRRLHRAWLGGMGQAQGPDEAREDDARRFTRTRAAVEHELSSRGTADAWSHVLRTPEEIGATQGRGRFGWLRWRRSDAAAPATPPSERGSRAPGVRVADFVPLLSGRDGRRVGAGRRGRLAFVLALCTGALVSALLFGSMLGLLPIVQMKDLALQLVGPSEAWLAQWRPAEQPAAADDLVVAGLPEPAPPVAGGQGGPEIEIGAYTAAGGAPASHPGVGPADGVGVVPGSVAIVTSGRGFEQLREVGRRLQDRGELAQAIAVYREAATLRPGHGPTVYALGMALEAHGDVDAAIARYREAVALEPAHAAAQRRLEDLLRARQPEELAATGSSPPTLDP